MNNKGQALVEFVLILPVFLFILFAVYDFGKIYSSKNSLENNSRDIISLFNNGKSLNDINNLYDDLVISFNLEGDYYKVIIKSSIDLVTPGFNKIFGSPYEIEVERYIPYVE